VLEQVRASPSDYVKVAIVDTDGILRGKYLDKAKFLGAATGSGFGFCDVVFGWDADDQCYDNGTYTGWTTGYPDGAVRIDLGTHRRIPWEDGRDFFLCDFVGSGQDYSVCPRLVLAEQVERATAAGFTGFFGLEFEWFNFREDPQSAHAKSFRGLDHLTPGMFGYSVLRQTQNQGFFDALLTDLRAFGVTIEGLHTETGPGVFEAAILYSTALEAADRATLFKAGTKEIGHRFGIMPTFMARYDTALPGCSGHTHQSLWDAAGERNLFHDDGDPQKMSALFRHYVAGILELLPVCLPLLAPTVNSYKRLVDGFWAPTKPTWGVDNRTVAARVLTPSASSTRLELRVPGADVNPYFSVAFGLAAGLFGIERGLELRPETHGSAYIDDTAERLPRDLKEATEAMAASPIVRELFGDGFVDHFCATREWEWRQFNERVTDWELQRYFEII
jgi:glutamine synthetase